MKYLLNVVFYIIDLQTPCRTSVATVRPWADRTALLAAVR